MSVDRGMFVVVPILIVVGCIVGLVLSIVPRVMNRLWRHRPTPVSRAVQATYVTAYVGIGVWVHHSLGVTYAQELAAANPERCHFGEDMSGCGPWFDGRQGWIFLWVIAGARRFCAGPQGV